ncbi:GntR family transcriptional regulator [Shinella daejeonensis]|uniref:GntR family transcriptional regulator n=1 Tax=Shinella daejeonensis TaxID=659017 RepID=UPI0020C7BB30|nr:GntR family transcriptional regulator [Shinella daejeonensis]MCP8894814.1 GntR family transcriptional regulator [Shinella daejeonensis]
MSVERNSPIPLYFQLAESLRAAIDSGVYGPGSKLPTESELCEQYDVSRSVVRQALQSLARDNLIETERGRGAFVLERKVPIALVQQLDPLRDSMAKAGFKLTTRVLRQERIDPPAYIAGYLGEDEAVFLERTRYADGVVFLVVRNYLPYSRFPDLLSSNDLGDVSLYTYLASKHDAVATTGKRQVEMARLNDESIAVQLHVEMNSYVLFNREITYDQNGKVLEYYESWHHPDRTQLSIDLQRAQ